MLVGSGSRILNPLVEEGIEHARTTADQHALDLATAEQERLILPLRTKAAALDSSSAATRAGIWDTARTLKEYEISGSRLSQTGARYCRSGGGSVSGGTEGSRG